MNVIHNDNFCNWELRVHQEHCLSCFSSNCEHDLCTVRSCPWACPSRMHSCKMEDHELVCAKVKRPCPNKNNGCRAIINTTEIMRHLPGCPGGTVSCNFKWYRKCLDPDITNAISSRSRHQLDDLHKTYTRSVVHFEFVCLKSLRRDEYSSHAKFHRTLMEYTDINQIKCPLTYRGCGFTVKKRFPKKGQLQFDSILRCPSIRYHDVALDDYCNSKLANSDMYIKSKNYYDARRTAINSTDERIPNGSDMVPKVKTSLEQPPGDSRDLISQLPEEPLRLLLKCLDSIDLRNLSSCSPYWKCRLSWELPSRGIIDFGWMKYHKRWIRNEQEDSFSTHCSLPNVIEEQSESEIIRHIPICKFNNFLQSEKDYAKGIQMFTDSRYINR